LSRRTGTSPPGDQNLLSDYLQDKKSAGTAGIGPEMPMMVEEKPTVWKPRQMDALEKQLGPAIAGSYNNLGAIGGSEGNTRVAL
jgi:hypothetical protein